MNKTKTYVLLITIIVIVVLVSSVLADEIGKQTPTLGSDRIKLPDPRNDSNTSIEKALLKRRSIREYKNKTLTISDISQLLWAAQGITDSKGLRTAPSAGALYPLELYILISTVSDLPDGIYKYNPYKHELLRIVKGDKRTELCNAALGQPM